MIRVSWYFCRYYKKCLNLLNIVSKPLLWEFSISFLLIVIVVSTVAYGGIFLTYLVVLSTIFYKLHIDPFVFLQYPLWQKDEIIFQW